MSRDLGSRSIYVIGVSENPVKIGIADRVADRLAGLQIGCPDALNLYHSFKVPYDLAQPIEAAAHAELRAHHRRGEWFNVHHDEAAGVVSRLRAEMVSLRKHASKGGDLIDKLAAHYELHVDARSAAVEYRDRLAAKDERYVGSANGWILRQAGMAAYAVFSLVIAQKTPLSNLKGEEAEKANAALARALNELVAFDAQFRRLHDIRTFQRKHPGLVEACQSKRKVA